jgi:FecR protein
MKKINRKSWATLALLSLMLGLVQAADFRKDSKITQIQGNVQVVTAPGQAPVSAKLNDTFANPSVIKTGAQSRAELTAGDQTVIRVGANSVFTYGDKSREMVLTQGSVLFNTPSGKGGGVIKTAAVTAAVTGSTVAMTTTSNGGAKVCPIESPCTVTGANGRSIGTLQPGQLMMLMPNQAPLIVVIDLGAFVKSSGLLQSFDKPLSQAAVTKIESSVSQQEKKIESKSDTYLVDGLSVKQEGILKGDNSITHQDLSRLLNIAINSRVSELLALQSTGSLINIIAKDLNVSESFLTANAQNIFNRSLLLSNGLSFNGLKLIGQRIDSELGSSFAASIANNFSDLSIASLSIDKLNLNYSSKGKSASQITYSFPSSTTVLLGHDLTFSSGSYNLSSIQSVGAFAFGASDDLDINGSNITFSNATSDLGFGAADKLTLTNATVNAGSGVTNLAFGSGRGTTITGSTIINSSSTGRVDIASLADLSVTSSSFVAGNSVNMFSSQTLSLNSVSFSGGMSNIRMSAATVNLQNINFPGGSKVLLESKNGLANFGSSVPDHVNFISNVKYNNSADITNQSILNSQTNIKLGKQ